MNEDEITYGNAEAALGMFVNAHPNYRIAFASIAGSHSFGWAVPGKSDIDIRGVYVVPTEEFFGFDSPPETIEMKCPEYNTEFQMHEIKKFTNLMIQPNMNMLDCIFVEENLIIEEGEYYEKLKEFGLDSLSKQCFSHVQGMVIHMKKHRNKYNMNEPKKNLYIFRELMRGIVLFETGEIVNNIWELADILDEDEIRDEVEVLLTAKAEGRFLEPSERSIGDFIERKLEERLLASKEFSPLAQRPKDDLKKRAEKFILDIRRKDYETRV